MQAIYNIPATPSSASANSLAVSGFLGEVANPDDLKVPPSFAHMALLLMFPRPRIQAFLAALRPDITSPVTFAEQNLDGGSNQGNGTVEAVCPTLLYDHN